MSAERLEQIQARADKATPGPWELEPFAGVACLATAPNGNLVVDYSTWTDDHYADMADVEALASFVAHAREDVPYLLAKLAAIRELADAHGKVGFRVTANDIRATLDA